MKKPLLVVGISCLGIVLSSCTNLDSEMRTNAEESPLACAFIVAQKIEKSDDKNAALTLISLKYADAGQYDQALKIAKTIREESGKSSDAAMVGLARATLLILEKQDYLALGHLDTAESLLSRVSALAEIASKYARIGQYEQAFQIANTIEDATNKADALAEIANEQAKTAQKDKALGTLAKAYQIIDVTTIPSSKAVVFARIGVVYAKAGNEGKALETLSQAIEITKTEKDSFLKPLLLATIAGAYAEARQYDQARQVARTIEDTTPPAFDFSTKEEKWAVVIARAYRAKAMVKVAKAYAEAKEYDQALQIAKAIDPALFRVDAIAEIASNYSETGQSEQAFQIVGTIPEDPDALAPKAEALAKISRKYAEIGQKDKALETVTQALSLAKLAPGDYFKAKALAEIAGAYARGGDYDKATQVAKTIKDVPLNAVALTKIASALADTGNMIDLFK